MNYARNYSDALQYAAAPNWFGPAGVSHARLSQWLGNRSQRRLGANKTVHKDGDDIHVRLHSTNVVTVHKDGGYTVRTGGWHTPTTRRTIQYLTGLPMHSDGKGGSVIGGHPFEEGMRVPVEAAAQTQYHTLPSSPELETLWKAATEDPVASKAFADYLQDNGDWRHHLFANPASPTVALGSAHGSDPHLDGSRYTLHWFNPDGVTLVTHSKDASHMAKLNREQYAQMRADAATAGVHFPPHRPN